MRKSKTAAATILLSSFLCLIGRTLGASAPEPGKIAGMVLDVNQARIVNAGVTVTNGKSTYRTTSNDEGKFSISLPAGEYRLKISAYGFRDHSETVSLTSGDTRDFKVTLQVAKSQNPVPAAEH